MNFNYEQYKSKISLSYSKVETQYEKVREGFVEHNEHLG